MTSLAKENKQHLSKGKKRVKIISLIVLLVLLVLLILLISFFINKSTYSLSSCQQLNNETQKLIDERKYAEAHKRLTTYQGVCLISPQESIPKESDKKAALFLFQHNFAMASDGIRETDQAKKYAQLAIQTNKSMTIEDRKKDSRHIERVLNVVIIANGERRAY